jgi:hypothetical protein
VAFGVQCEIGPIIQIRPHTKIRNISADPTKIEIIVGRLLCLAREAYFEWDQISLLEDACAELFLDPSFSVSVYLTFG